MSQASRLLALLTLSALLSSCMGEGEPTRPQETSLLVATSGTVRLRRDGWKEFVPITVGTRLRATDLLDVEGSVTVLCAGPMVKTLTALGKPPCPTEGGSFLYDGARFRGGQRAVIPGDLPYTLFPRGTLILDPHPLLAWNDSGAPPYTVMIDDAAGRRVWQQAGVQGMTLPYPDDAPALEPGVDYLLIVHDASGKSSEYDPMKGLGFRLVSAAALTEIERQRNAIIALEGIDDSARKLALADTYTTWRGEGQRALWGEAVQLLEQVAQTRDSPAVRLWLGDLLWAMRLPDESAAAYQEALGQAEAVGDRASQAAAEAGLWRVSGRQDQLDAALRLYERLGDQGEAAALREESRSGH